MSPTKLLLAFDCPASFATKLYGEVLQFRQHPNFGGIKISLSLLLSDAGRRLTELCVLDKVPVMWDLKLYNIQSEIKRDVQLAEESGVKWLTVYERSVNFALSARKTVDIVAVKALTSDTYMGQPLENPAFEDVNGLVCHPKTAPFYQELYPNKLLFCPGIRYPGETTNEHIKPLSVNAVATLGIDYAIIGRPIYLAPNPAAALNVVLETLAKAP